MVLQKYEVVNPQQKTNFHMAIYKIKLMLMCPLLSSKQSGPHRSHTQFKMFCNHINSTLVTKEKYKTVTT